MHLKDLKDKSPKQLLSQAEELGVEDGIPYEDDLYLDVVIVPDGRIHVLDEDELKSAYDRKEVSKEEYEMAYRVANKIIEKGKNRYNKRRIKTNIIRKKIYSFYRCNGNGNGTCPNL